MDATDEAIYGKHRDDLVRFAAALVGADRAEDVLSGVIVRVLARGGLVRLQEPRAYLFKAVLNEARSTLRRRRSVPLPESLSTVDGEDVEIVDAVMRLPARQRAAVYLVYWQGESMAGVAGLMGCAPGSVKRYLHLARRRLKGALR
jgi:RNA polymerase sigma-70 factor (ECF subfamily)